jgi:hypothetical protein
MPLASQQAKGEKWTFHGHASSVGGSKNDFVAARLLRRMQWNLSQAECLNFVETGCWDRESFWFFRVPPIRATHLFDTCTRSLLRTYAKKGCTSRNVKLRQRAVIPSAAPIARPVDRPHLAAIFLKDPHRMKLVVAHKPPNLSHRKSEPRSDRMTNLPVLNDGLRRMSHQSQSGHFPMGAHASERS